MIFFEGTHRRQLDGSPLASENCTPTSGANGLRASSGGRLDKSGGELRALIPKDKETDPKTPGWSLGDLKRAMDGLKVPYKNKPGTWADVEATLRSGLFVVLQGDSDQFPGGTCSANFKGDHCVGLHPGDLGDGTWLLADPLCPSRRREKREVLQAYAEKFAKGKKLTFGVFTTPVPQEDDMKITAIKGEDWTPGPKDAPARRPFRSRPERTNEAIVGHIEIGQIVRTIAEVEAGGEKWRLTEIGGQSVYLLRSDFDPLFQGGDPAVDKKLSDYIARTGG